MNKWNRQTVRTDSPPLATDQAFQIFENWAQDTGRNYDGDMVRTNLANEVACGATPQEAVDRLVARVPR